MPELPLGAGQVLCEIARSAIAGRLGAAHPRFDTAAEVRRPDPGGSDHLGYRNEDSWLDTPGAAFVTLTQQGALRGCIGSLTAFRPLREDVAANAQDEQSVSLAKEQLKVLQTANP